MKTIKEPDYEQIKADVESVFIAEGLDPFEASMLASFGAAGYVKMWREQQRDEA